jgi:hypothetical protein
VGQSYLQHTVPKLAHIPEMGGNVILGLEDNGGLLMEIMALLRQGDTGGAPDKKLYPKFLLQALDILADALLGNKELLGSLGEAFSFTYGFKILNLL